jgi:SRSO17 transposase
MDAGALERVRTELEAFAGEVFAGFARADQRVTGLTYLRGLMLDGQRKSMQPMAERLGTDHQRLQQFLTSSTWDHAAVRRRLAAKAVEVLDPVVWIVDDTGFVKDGYASPGVARQYSGTLGKVANCQIAVSVHAAGQQGKRSVSAVLDWRLFLPPAWDETTLPDEHGVIANAYLSRRWDSTATLGVAGEVKVKLRKPPPTPEQVAAKRAKSKIPDDVRYVPKWRLALDMFDELAGWGLTAPVVTADAGYGQVAAFRAGLTERDIRYVVATTATTTAHPGDAEPGDVPYAGVGKRPLPRYPKPARTLKDLARNARAEGLAPVQVRWREAARSSPDKPVQMSGWFTATRVRPAGRHVKRHSDGTYVQAWLLTQWATPQATEPSDYWLSDLPDQATLLDLVTVAKARWRIEECQPHCTRRRVAAA